LSFWPIGKPFALLQGKEGREGLSKTKRKVDFPKVDKRSIMKKGEKK